MYDDDEELTGTELSTELSDDELDALPEILLEELSALLSEAPPKLPPEDVLLETTALDELLVLVEAELYELSEFEDVLILELFGSPPELLQPLRSEVKNKAAKIADTVLMFFFIISPVLMFLLVLFPLP